LADNHRVGAIGADITDSGAALIDVTKGTGFVTPGAIESMAVELERIGEGQRFLTKLLSERSQSSDAAQRIGAGK
jgi:hypothetical protein